MDRITIVFAFITVLEQRGFVLIPRCTRIEVKQKMYILWAWIRKSLRALGDFKKIIDYIRPKSEEA